MTISATKTAGVMSGIKKLNSQINGYQNKVNEIKRQVGYHEDEILKSEKRKQTICSSDVISQCWLIFKLCITKGHKRNVHRFNSTKSFSQDCRNFSSRYCHMNDLCKELLGCVSEEFFCACIEKCYFSVMNNN